MGFIMAFSNMYKMYFDYTPPLPCFVPSPISPISLCLLSLPIPSPPPHPTPAPI